MNNKVSIVLEDNRKINLELYNDVAPISVNNFLKLVDEHYYDGIIFHRVIDKFMIQTGGYYIKDNKIYESKKVDSIKGEFKSNGVENNIKHKYGVISMARTNEKDSASSQFFICASNCSYLDGEYAAFGKTIDDESLATVLDISHVKTTTIGYLNDFPINPIIIKEIVRID